MQESIDSFTTLNEGDRVRDKKADDDEDDDEAAMRVINANVGQANEISIGGTLVCDHEGNEEYPGTDAVVEVVFESHLDGRVTDWKSQVGEIKSLLREFREDWSIDVSTYHYPRSRLKQINDPLPVNTDHD